MILFIPWVTAMLGKTKGYIVSNMVYWGIFCLPLTILYTKGSWTSIKSMYSAALEGKKIVLYNAAAFFPVVATGIIVFIPTVQKAPAVAILLALAYAVVNGTMEELFWRGLYNTVFTSIGTAYIIPTILFSMWHIALALANGMLYHGGAVALLGGAAFMGVLWGAVAYETKSIRFTTMAHVLTNFFAFSGLIYDNWYA